MEHLSTFAVVVEQESLNRASRILNLSQPALSRKIMALETALDVRLFDRKGKRLELTKAGQICYEYAVQMRQTEREMLQAVSGFKTGVASSSLTVGASLTTLQSTLPDLITFYTRDYPLTDIKALTGKTHEIVTMVQEKKVDIGLVASFVKDSGLECKPLFDDHLCLVLPSGHPLGDSAVVAMEDVQGLPMILFSKGTWYRILMDEVFHRYSVFPNVKMEIDSFEAIMRLVSTCQTATLLPKSYLRSSLLADNGLSIRIIPELEETKRTTSLLYAQESLADSTVRMFVETASRYFSVE